MNAVPCIIIWLINLSLSWNCSSTYILLGTSCNRFMVQDVTTCIRLSIHPAWGNARVLQMLSACQLEISYNLISIQRTAVNAELRAHHTVACCVTVNVATVLMLQSCRLKDFRQYFYSKFLLKHDPQSPYSDGYWKTDLRFKLLYDTSQFTQS